MMINIPRYLIVLFVAGIIVIGMTLYPPWSVSLQTSNRSMSQFYGWGYLFSPPESPEVSPEQNITEMVRMLNAGMPLDRAYDYIAWRNRALTVKIDFSILFLEYFLVVLLMAIIGYPVYLRENKAGSPEVTMYQSVASRPFVNLRRYIVPLGIFILSLVVYAIVRTVTDVGSPGRFIGTGIVVGSGMFLYLKWYKKKI